MKKRSVLLTVSLAFVVLVTSSCGSKSADFDGALIAETNTAPYYADISTPTEEIYYSSEAEYDRGTLSDSAALSDRVALSGKAVQVGTSNSGSENVVSPTVPEETETTSTVLNPEKLVYRAGITIEVIEYDRAIEEIKNRIKEYDGLVQNENYSDSSYSTYANASSQVGYRNCYITVRIPTAEFESFLSAVGDVGHVTSQNSTVENISRQYYNSKAYLESYENQLKVLLEMYEKTTSIQEMLLIEERISNLQAEILSLTTRIQSMDMDVAYSTINITLREVIDYSKLVTPEEQRSFGDRVRIAFADSWDNFVSFLEGALFLLIGAIWPIIALAIIGGITMICVKISEKKKKKASEKSMPTEEKKE